MNSLIHTAAPSTEGWWSSQIQQTLLERPAVLLPNMVLSASCCCSISCPQTEPYGHTCSFTLASLHFRSASCGNEIIFIAFLSQPQFKITSSYSDTVLKKTLTLYTQVPNLVFLAVSPEEKESWINALNGAITRAKNRIFDEVSKTCPSICILHV